MQKSKRLRIFAGPNGSGKSTLFREFSKKFNPGFFVNADEIEKSLKEKHFLDLEEFGLEASQANLNKFSKLKVAKSLINKAKDENRQIDIIINDNFIINNNKLTNSYEASFVALFIRYLLVEKGISFSFETVMSNVYKVDEINKAKELGYKIYLYFICTDDLAINVSRVKNRVNKGGHNVSLDKIKSRYINSLKNLQAAISLSDRVFLFDNSYKELNLVAELNQNKLELKSANIPNWFVEHVLPYYL
jgi:predicted ABC-type ATPase